MATNKKHPHQTVEFSIPETFASLKDCAYQHAGYSDKAANFVTYIKSQDSGFPDTVKDETKAEIYSGYTLRFNERYPAVLFMKDGEDTYIPVLKGKAPDNAVPLGVEVAISYTAHALGAMKSDRPNYYAIIKDIRRAYLQYASNKYKKLLATGREMEVGKRTRAANNAFKDSCKVSLDTLIKRNKVALQKGDPTAVGVTKLDEAIKAFYSVLQA
jgi:hypothetical protein